MDEREEENICSFLLPWEEFRVPLCCAVKAILVVISQQDIESKYLTWPSWVGTILHFQPGVSVLVGTGAWTVSVPVPVAVVVIVLVCVGVGASIMGVSMGVVAGVCVACIATTMISGVASMAWALVVLSIHYNPLQFWPEYQWKIRQMYLQIPAKPWSPSNRECDFETDSILSTRRTASKTPRRRSNMELRTSADVGHPVVNLGQQMHPQIT